MSPVVRARLQLGAVLLIGIVLQTTLVPDLRVAGVCPDLMLLITICVGLAGGSEQGASVGFLAGLLTDLFLTTTPVGLAALSYCVVGFGVGALRGNLLREGWLMRPLVSLVASGAGVVLFVLAGFSLGQTQLTLAGPAALARTAALVGVLNAVLAIAVGPIVSRACRRPVGTASRPAQSDRSALSR